MDNPTFHATFDRTTNRINARVHALKALRQARELTQVELASRLGIEQTHVSRLERADKDVYVSTLTRYVEATGGTLQLVAVYPDTGPITIDIGQRHQVADGN